MHHFEVPKRQREYRCACGEVWIRTPKGASNGRGKTRRPDSTGWMQCCSDRVFGWDIAPSYYQATPS